MANTWKIGRKAIGDGLLLIVAVQDRKLRIEVAKTLEGAIPDLAAKRIIDEAITPRFKQGDYRWRHRCRRHPHHGAHPRRGPARARRSRQPGFWRF